MCISDENLYYVGGVVRDEFLGAKSLDTDFCYEGDAIEFAQRKHFDIIKINPEFGTVRIKFNNREIDIASTRFETYPRKGHLPKVNNIGCALKDDLQRRDFTINAMAKKTTNNLLIDYFDGLGDLQKKVLKVLHKDSFKDDPTRIIRGLKFSVRFGFELEPETKQIQDEYLSNINYDISYYRLRKELIETFSLNSAEAFDKFVEQKIYKLLGQDVKVPSLSGSDIKNELSKNPTKHLWFMYVAPFIELNTTKLPLLKSEKRILSWCERLKTQLPTNNTPKESILLARMVN